MKPRWYLWSDRNGELQPPQLVRRPARGALISSDGFWAELHDANGVVAVWVQLGGRVLSRNW